MEIDCGLGAFFGLQKGYVLAVIHKKVLGQDSRATGVADDVEVLFDVGIWLTCKVPCLSYPQILQILYMKKVQSLTPRSWDLKVLIFEFRDSAPALVE